MLGRVWALYGAIRGPRPARVKSQLANAVVSGTDAIRPMDPTRVWTISTARVSVVRSSSTARRQSSHDQHDHNTPTRETDR
jgi:hypothetical protein